MRDQEFKRLKQRFRRKRRRPLSSVEKEWRLTWASSHYLLTLFSKHLGKAFCTKIARRLLASNNTEVVRIASILLNILLRLYKNPLESSESSSSDDNDDDNDNDSDSSSESDKDSRLLPEPVPALPV